MKSLKSEVASLKRDFKTMAEKQSKVLQLVKAIKRGCDSTNNGYYNIKIIHIICML